MSISVWMDAEGNTHILRTKGNKVVGKASAHEIPLSAAAERKRKEAAAAMRKAYA